METELREVHSYSPGPCQLPRFILSTLKEDMIDFNGTGRSILEIPMVKLKTQILRTIKRSMILKLK